jgi:VCBS repeat-containing protein
VTWDTAKVTTDHAEQTDHAAQGDFTDFTLTPTGSPNVYEVSSGGQTAGTITLLPGGGYTFEVDAAYEPQHGDHTINIPYTLTDGDGDTADAVLHITISNVNDMPVITIPGDTGGFASTGDVKEEGVYAAGDRTGTLTPAEHTPTAEGDAVPGEHKLVTTGTVTATDADGDLLTFGISADGSATPGSNEPLYVLVGSNGAYSLSPTLPAGADYYGTIQMTDTGDYTFTLNDQSSTVNALGEGVTKDLTFTATATDNSGAAGNATGTAEIKITIHGSNERPTLELTETALSFDEDVSGTLTGSAKGSDADTGDSLSYSFADPGDGTVHTTLYALPDGTFSPNAPADGDYFGTFAIDPASGEYSFTVNTGAACVEALYTGEDKIINVPVVVQDEHGAYATQELQVTIQGADDAPVIDLTVLQPNGDAIEAGVRDDDTSTAFTGNVSEPGVPVVTGVIKATDADAGDKLTYQVQDANGDWHTLGDTADAAYDGSGWTFDAAHGTVTVTANGDGSYGYAYALDNADPDVNALPKGETLGDGFKVLVQDKNGNSAEAPVEITIQGTNDQPALTVEQTAYSFTDDVADAGSTIYADKGFSGTFGITDVDTGDEHSFALTHAGTGEIGNSTVNESHSASGGYGESVTVEGTYGSLTVNLATGEYSYSLYPKYADGQAPTGLENRMKVDDLDLGDSYKETFTLKVKDLNDAWDEKTITIDIHGAKESPEIKTFAHDVYEDRIKYETTDDTDHRDDDLVYDADGKPVVESTTAPLTVAGNALDGAQLGVGDAGEHVFSWNNGQGIQWSGNTGTLTGEYGTFTVNKDGTYSFTLNNLNTAVQDLKAGDTRDVTLAYSYYDDDGGMATGTVTVTVHGSNDGISLTTDNLASVRLIQEDGYYLNVKNDYPDSTDGFFRVGDPDVNDARYLDLALTGPDGGDIPIALGKDAAGALEDGSVTINITDPATGTIIGTLTVTAQRDNTHETTYSYKFDLDQTAADYLNEGQRLDYQLTYTVQDPGGAGGEIKQTVTITVVGTNDKPVLDLTNPNASLHEDLLESGAESGLISGTFTVTDADADGGTNNPHNTFSGNGGTTFTADGADLVLQGQYGTLTVKPDGTYEYQTDPAKVNALAEGQQAKEHFEIIARDIHGTWSDKAPVDITLTGSNDGIQVISNTDGALNLKESGVAANAAGSQHGSADTPFSGNATVTGTSSASESGKFQILDPDKIDVKHITLSIGGTDYNLGNGSTSGSVTTYTLSTDYGIITVKGTAAADGTTTYSYTYALDNGKAATQALSEGQKVEQDCVIKVDDGHGSSASHNFTVTIEGTNDMPVIAGTGRTGTVKETGVYKAGVGDYGDAAENKDTTDGGTGATQHQLTVSGTLKATDADSDNDQTSDPSYQLAFSLVTGGTSNATYTTGASVTNDWGTLTMQPDGNWTFTLNDAYANSLGEGDTQKLTFTAAVTDNHGATATAPITVTVKGTNDRPELTVTNDPTADVDANGHVFVVEDDMAHQSVSGALSWTDVDTKDMTAGHDIRISFTAEDGSTRSVTDARGSSADNHLEIEGQYGTLYYDRGTGNGQGEWRYELDNSKAQHLAEGETAEETFTVMVRDQYGAWQEQPLTIAVQGTDDDSRFDLSALNPSQKVIEAGVVPTKPESGQTPVYVDSESQPVTGRIIAQDADEADPAKLIYKAEDKDGNWHELGNETDGAYNSATQAWEFDTEHGSVSITRNPAGGFDYTYVLNNDDPYVDRLNQNDRGTDSFKVSVADKDGTAVEQSVNISIVGTNDRPDFVGNDFTAAETAENSGIYAGVLDTTDPDSGHRGSTETGDYNLTVTGLADIATGTDGAITGGSPATFVNTEYGLCTIKPDGSYTFVMNDAGRDALRNLGEDEKLQVQIPVRVTDPLGAYSDEYVTITLSEIPTKPTLDTVKTGISEDGWASGVNGAVIDNADSVSGDLTNNTTAGSANHGDWLYAFSGAAADSAVDATHDFGSGGEACQSVSNQYGTLYLAEDGRYEFVLDQNAPDVQKLQSGQVRDLGFDITVRDVDRSDSDDGRLIIEIHGTNDRPELRFSSAFAGTLDQASLTDADPNSVTFTSLDNTYQIRGLFSADDWDNSVYRDGPNASDPNTGDAATADRAQAEVVFCFIKDGKPVQTITTAYGAVTVNADTGEYTYVFNVMDPAAQSAFDAASAGSPLVDTFELYARDSNGAYSDSYTVKLELAPNETTPGGGTGGTGGGGGWPGGGTGGGGTPQPPQLVVAPNHAHEDYAGTGHGGAASVDGSNYTGHQTADYDLDGDPAHKGNIQVTVEGTVSGGPSGGYYFINADEKHVQSVPAIAADGTYYGDFMLNPVTGDYVFVLNSDSEAVQRLDGGQIVDIPGITVGCDGAEANLPFQIIGTSDRPTFSSGLTATVNEDPDQETGHTYGGQSTTGQLTGQDRDADDTLTFSPKGADAAESGPWVLQGTYGNLTLNADGSYEYTVNPGVNVPHQGYEEHFQVSVTDDGDFAGKTPLSSDGTLTIHLNGQNTPPTATVTPNLTVTEDAFGPDGFVVSNLGHITAVVDYDGDSVKPSLEHGNYAAGQYGTLFLNPDGSFQYRLDNASLAVQQLKPGSTLDETFTVTLSDGHGGTTQETVTVSINGAEDKPNIFLLGGENDATFGAGRSLDLLETEAGHGKAIVFDVDAGDAANARFSLDGVGAPDGASPYTTGDGEAWAWINGDYRHVGDFVINDISGEYTFTPTKEMEALKVGEQISFDVRVLVNGGEADPNGTEATVTVTVTGTNTVPVFTAVTRTGLKEDDGSQRQVDGKLEAFDPDAADGELQFYVTGGVKTGPTTWQGEYGTLSLKPDGSYTYTMDNAKVQGANVDNYLHDVFNVVARDQYGASSEGQKLDFTIEGVNDLPVIGAVTAMPAVTEDTTLLSSGQMNVSDVDDALTAASFTVGKGSLSDNSGLTDTAQGDYGKLVIDGYEGGVLKYHYELDNALANSLGRNAKPVETFTVMVDDGHGALVAKTVSVTVNGVNDAPTLNPVTDFSASEATGAAVGTPFSGTDPDAGDTLTYQVGTHTALTATEKAAGAVGEGYTHKTAGDHGTLYYNQADGTNKYVPNGNVQEGATATDSFTVRASDGAAYSASQSLTVTVEGRGDAPVVTIGTPAALTAANHESGTTSRTVTLTVTDLDAGDTKAVRFTTGQGDADDWADAASNSLTGTYGTLTLNGSGNLVYNLSQTGAVQALQAGQSVTETFTVLVQDSTGNTVAKTVTFTVNGTNDTPVISGVQGMAQVAEPTDDSAVIQSSGSFTVTDVDDALTTLTPAVINPAGSYGNLAITGYDPDTGLVSYTYTLDNAKADKLGAGQTATETFTIRVTDGHGGYTNQNVTVKVAGTNDNPTIDITGGTTLVEDAEHIGASVTVNLKVQDVDLNDAGNLTVELIQGGSAAAGGAGLAGQFGTLQMVNGNLVYTVDRSLGTGTGQDTFTVKVSDGHGGSAEQTVTFNVTSFNEAPTISVGGSPNLTIADAAAAADIQGDQLVAATVTGSLGLDIGDAEADSGFTIANSVTIGGKHAGEQIDGKFGTLTFDDDGEYEYTLDGSLDVLRELAQSGGSLDDTFTATVTDAEGKESSTTFNVHLEAGQLAAVDETRIYNAEIDGTLVLGTDGNDRITVNGGDNTIYGGGGNDVISALGEGTNTLFGGGGNDLFIVNSSSQSANTLHGGEGVDFLVGLDSMDVVEELFAENKLESIDVLLVGNAGVTSLNNLASLGLSVEDGGSLNMSERWVASAEHAPDGYTAFTTTYTTATGGTETLTALVNNEIIKSETGSGS